MSSENPFSNGISVSGGSRSTSGIAARASSACAQRLTRRRSATRETWRSSRRRASRRQRAPVACRHAELTRSRPSNGHWTVANKAGQLHRTSDRPHPELAMQSSRRVEGQHRAGLDDARDAPVVASVARCAVRDCWCCRAGAGIRASPTQSSAAVRRCACGPSRCSNAPIVNSAIGVATMASVRTMSSTGDPAQAVAPCAAR